MLILASRTSFHERPDSRSKLYWLDIDVIFEDITRQQQLISSRTNTARRPRSSSQYSALHGVGTVANALSVGDIANTFDRFQVDVAAIVHAEDNFGPPEPHRSARMIWNEVNVSSPRLEIHANENAAPFGGAVRDKTDRRNLNVDENCS
jgi:hypothetical protein